MPVLTVVTAHPTGARWHVELPGRAPIETRTLKMAETMAVRRVGGAIDLQVALRGLEDLCADAVELSEQSDALAVEALRMRRVAAQALSAAGVRTADVGHLMGIAGDSVKHLLDVPIDTAWMSTTHAPPTHRQLTDTASSSSHGTTREIVAVIVTRCGSGWLVHLTPGRRPTGRTSLVRAEMLVRDRVGDVDADIVLCPQLSDDLEQTIRAADLATADARDYQQRAYALRRDVARRLRDLGVGFQDIGYLLEMHAHRVRLLLEG